MCNGCLWHALADGLLACLVRLSCLGLALHAGTACQLDGFRIIRRPRCDNLVAASWLTAHGLAVVGDYWCWLTPHWIVSLLLHTKGGTRVGRSGWGGWKKGEWGKGVGLGFTADSGWGLGFAWDVAEGSALGGLGSVCSLFIADVPMRKWLNVGASAWPSSPATPANGAGSAFSSASASSLPADYALLDAMAGFMACVG